MSQWMHDGQFGERLKRARTFQAYSRRELSDLCGGTPSADSIARYEDGISLPRSGEILRKLAEILQVTPGWLLLGEEL